MLSRIEISNFKAITEKLTLDGLANVNYLVGPNGCGKSSVLEALSSFQNDKKDNPYQHKETEWYKYDEQTKKCSIGIGFSSKRKIYHKDNSNVSLSYSGESSSYSIELEGNININYSKNYVGFNYLNKYGSDDEGQERAKSTFRRLCNDHWLAPYIILDNPIKNIKEFFKKFENKKKERSYWQCWKYNLDFDSYYEILPDLKIGLNGKLRKVKNKYYFFTHEELEDEYYDYEYTDYTKGTIELNNLSDGQKYIVLFLLQIQYYLTSVDQDSTTKHKILSFLIDEPERGLHPKLQKTLIDIFSIISSKYHSGVQFLISTHSPFIISAAAKEDGQKVYLIEGGQCAKPEGYIGYEMKEIANEMLGAKTTDILFEHYILCEGSTDVEILNYIFQPYKNVKFILADNKDEVNKKIAVGLILNKISDEIKISGFVDWDGDNKTTKEFKENWEEKFGLKISDTKPKQKLESFLYDKSVLEILKKDFPKIDTNREIDDKIDPNLDSFFQDSKDKKHTGHCENWFRLEWQNLGYDKFTNSNKKDFQLNKLAEIIREMGKVELNLPKEERNNIYWQLHKLIFT